MSEEDRGGMSTYMTGDAEQQEFVVQPPSQFPQFPQFPHTSNGSRSETGLLEAC